MNQVSLFYVAEGIFHLANRTGDDSYDDEAQPKKEEHNDKAGYTELDNEPQGLLFQIIIIKSRTDEHIIADLLRVGDFLVFHRIIRRFGEPE